VSDEQIPAGTVSDHNINNNNITSINNSNHQLNNNNNFVQQSTVLIYEGAGGNAGRLHNGE